MMDMKALLKLIASLAVCYLAARVGAVFTSTSIQTWYLTLNKPFFTPPNWLFAPVWLTLYTLMGISLFLIWQQDYHQPQIKIALAIFAVQLILNTLWSLMFFGLQSPLAGLIVIILLWVAIAVTIKMFFPLSKPAVALLIPYILWVTLAAVLNAAIVVLN